MNPKTLARTIVPMAPIAMRTVVDSLGTAGPPGAGAGTGSIGSALDRLAALRAELHVARDLVAIRTSEELRRAAFPAELQPRGHGLAALHARLAAGRGGRVGP